MNMRRLIRVFCVKIKYHEKKCRSFRRIGKDIDWYRYHPLCGNGWTLVVRFHSHRTNCHSRIILLPTMGYRGDQYLRPGRGRVKDKNNANKKGGLLRDHLFYFKDTYVYQARSYLSRFITLFHAATKSFTNFSLASADP